MDEATRSPIIRLCHHLRLQVVEGEGAFLVSERGVTLLEGQLAVDITSRLDGTRRPQEIVAELSDHYPGEQVRQVINQLVTAGLAVLEHDDEEQHLSGDATFYEMGGIERSAAAHRLANAVVAVHAIGDVDSAQLIEHLSASGVGSIVAPIARAEDASEANLSVVITDDYRRHEIDPLNRTALTTERPWILARTVGSVLWVGPLFRPSVTGCWACLAHRLAANFQTYSYLGSRVGGAELIGAATVRHQVGGAVGAGLVALEVIKTIIGTPVAEASVVTLDLLSGDSRRHYLTRRPQCPVCGDGTMIAARALVPLRFSSRRKVSTTDGGYRAIEPEAMVARFARQVSPITGVVTSLERVTTTPAAICVFTAGQNVARHVSDLLALRRGLRASSCGKGMTEIQARASAMGEAMERSSGVFQGDELRRRATLTELGDAAIHPNDCLLFSERQYEQRQFWNLGEPGFHTVFEPFLEDEAIDWSPIWSVTNQCVRWLPTQYLYYGYPIGNGRLFAYADSNGAASGTSLEDAALQGFCELIERDSVALWWYNRVRRPGVDLDSFRNAYIDRLREIYLGLGREVWALDLTADFGIPAIGAFSRAVNGEREDILIAFGAHLDPQVAVLRALTEMNQFLVAVLPPHDGAEPQYPGAAFANWCQTATLANQPYLVPDPQMPPRVAASWPTRRTDDLAADLAYCQSLVEARHLELLVLDQTRPDVGLPVVKVVVPGLRHFWPRFAPGRLYDVPVALDWCGKKTAEEFLNPVPIFI